MERRPPTSPPLPQPSSAVLPAALQVPHLYAAWPRGALHCSPPTSSSSTSSRRPRPPSRRAAGRLPAAHAGVELQPRAVEVPHPLSSVASTGRPGQSPVPMCPAPRLPPRSSPRPALMPIPDRTLQARCWREMPAFPGESSILAKLKRRRGRGLASALDGSRRDPSTATGLSMGRGATPSTVVSPGGLWAGGRGGWAQPGRPLLTCLRVARSPHPRPPLTSWGCGQPPSPAAPRSSGAGNLLVDVFSDSRPPSPALGPSPEEAFLRYWPFQAHLPPPQLPLPEPTCLPWLLPAPVSPSLPLGLSGLSLTLATLCLSFPVRLSLLFLLLSSVSFFLSLPSCCLSGTGCLPRLSSLVCSGIGWPSDWGSRLLRAPWLCWLTQLPAAE